MGFCIEYVYEVSFFPCIGWPKEVKYNPDHEMVAVVGGHFDSFLTGEMKLDNFTGYAKIIWSQSSGMTGVQSDRDEKKGVIEENRTKVLVAFYEWQAKNTKK
jgi:hypothetical protein